MKKKYNLFSYVTLACRYAPVAMIVVMVTAVTLSMVPALTIVTTSSFIDTALAIFDGKYPFKAIYAPLFWVAGLLAFDWVVCNITNYAWVQLRAQTTRKYLPALFEKKARLAYRHIENPKTWDLIHRVSDNAVEQIVMGYEAIQTFTMTLLRLMGILTVFVAQVWWAVLIIVGFSVPLFIISLRTGRSNYDARKTVESNIRRADYYSEVLTDRAYVEERSLFGFTDWLNRKWKEQFEYSRRLQLGAQIRNFIRRNYAQVCAASIWFIIAFVLIPPLRHGTLTIGMYIALIGSVTLVVQTVSRRLCRYSEKLSGYREYMKDLTAFFALEETADAVCLPAYPPTPVGRVEFRDVSFRYPGTQKKVLDHFSLGMEEGVRYAFVGANGAGKTTVTKLLTGLYPEYEGEILVGGRELRNYSQAEIKSMFSVVHQDFARYFVSLADNVALGAAGCPEETRSRAVREAVELAGLRETAASLPDGLSTELGKLTDSGQDLSGGQWQRVAIARAMAGGRSFCILDEPTAALDPVSESNVYAEFDRISAGRTTLFISHRLGSTRLADKIFVLDGGRVAEEGTHDELMAAGGIYADMYQAQRSWYQ